ncbi:hypothetical protein KAM621c_40210 [Citrobacter braakii]|uniref:Uncharacterized protein n=1 Tax=Citrobacter braakii TaxID=57706 RepID=A0AAD1P3Q8_CITBR|nr:hypothetical protein KAM621c_40210 [Citrobacter braakii]
MLQHFINAQGLRHRRGLLWAHVQAGIALLTYVGLPSHFPLTQAQRLMRAMQDTFPAVVAASHRPRIVAIFTAQVTSLQKQSQATARPVDAGERNDLTY